MKMKEESKKVGLKLNIQKAKFMNQGKLEVVKQEMARGGQMQA